MPPNSHLKSCGARLTPHQVGALRYQIVRFVERGLSEVEAALDGTGTASLRQAELFVKLLDKVLPRMRKGPKAEPKVRGTPLIDSLSAADLEWMLAEALGETDPTRRETASTERKPDPADLAKQRSRTYMREYERRHPELRKRRAAANAKRYASKKWLGERIRARKASEPPEEPWTREQDDAARRALRDQVAREKRQEEGRL